MSKQTSNIAKRSNGAVAKVIYVSVVIVLALLAGFFFYKYQDVNQKYTEATQTPDDRDRQLVSSVSKLYNIPDFDKEQPEVILVGDKTKLNESSRATQDFFDGSENGDYVLAYKDADISIIYRKAENRIIRSDNYANFRAAISPISIAIVSSEDLHKSIEEKITNQFKNTFIISKNKPTTELTKGIVVAASVDNQESAKQVAKLFGYEVGAAPSGEEMPKEAMIVVFATNSTPVQ